MYDDSVAGVPKITLGQLEAKGRLDHARIREAANYDLGHLRDRESAVRSNKGGVAGSGAESARGHFRGRNIEDNKGDVAGSGAEGARGQVAPTEINAVKAHETAVNLRKVIEEVANGRLQTSLSLESADMDGGGARAGAEIHGRTDGEGRQGRGRFSGVGVRYEESPFEEFGSRLKYLNEGRESRVYDNGDGEVVDTAKSEKLRSTDGRTTRTVV